jgi:thiazole synthase ThiGH ThiG subunit
LVEPFGGAVDVVIGAGVGAANEHDSYVRGGVDAVVVNGGLEEVGVRC